MTNEQTAWLQRNPDYRTVGAPRADAPRFVEFGTLYADGSYVQVKRGDPIVLQSGCVGVGRPEESR